MRIRTILALAIGTTLLLTAYYKGISQESSAQSKTAVEQLRFEYASVRFMEERTSIVWPDGKVENVLGLNGKTKFDHTKEKYPKGSDYRMYWLTIAMNIMGQRGFELAHMTNNDVVMKRQVTKP